MADNAVVYGQKYCLSASISLLQLAVLLSAKEMSPTPLVNF